MDDRTYGYYESPIGLIEVSGTGKVINTLYFVEERRGSEGSSAVVDEALIQLRTYFDAGLRHFDLPLAMSGTPFQKQVWQQLLTVNYGEMASYLDIANALENPKAVRAVGAANGQNPISIIVPCHRIIGSNGRLIGYGGGVWRKEWLLKHEGALLV